MSQQKSHIGGGTPRVVRVFVSSTFRDMQAERDELIKLVFPALRKICQQRGVTWSEVDLRWGITEQQAERGEVLPICLAEIERCRPFFIGLLGERYGWVPDEIPRELIDQQPWLSDHLDQSVTEMEFVHGVLANPAMADHAFFYLRDPSYVASLPADSRDDFIEAPSADEVDRFGAVEAEHRAERRRQKLASLKERIRSGFPAREYLDPQALGEMVLQDLTAAINNLFPESSIPDPLQREDQEHESFAESRAKVYIPRVSCYERLDQHLREDGPPLVIVGEAGSGKSALIANWVMRYREGHGNAALQTRGWVRLIDRFKSERVAEDQPFVLMHFVGATPHSTDWAAMLTRIIQELNRHCAADIEIPFDPDGIRTAFSRSLGKAAAKRRVVLILDGLNQLEDRDQAPDLVWLPNVIPANIRLILSSLPGRSLEELHRRNWPTMEIELLGIEERQQLIEKYLAEFAKELSKTRTERIAANPQTANPLFLRTLLDELRVFGIHEQLDSRIDHYLSATTIPDLYDRVLERYETDYERNRPRLIGDAMSMLWAARRGLSEAELLDLLGSNGSPLPVALWAPLYLAADQALVSRSGILGFLHNYLREAVTARYLNAPGAATTAHRRLADYFLAADIDARTIDELPWQLSKTRSWVELAEQFVKPEFLNRAWESARFDLQSFWAQIEANSHVRPLDVYSPVLHAPVDDATYAWNVSLLLSSMGHPLQTLELQDRLIEHYRDTGDVSNLAGALGNQSNARFDLGEYDAAMALAKEQETVSRRSNNRRMLAHSLASQARVLYLRGEAEAASGLFDSAARIAEEAGDFKSLSYWIGNHAAIFRDRGQLADALRMLREQERICRQQGDQEGLSLCLGNQAHLLQESGENDAALAQLDQVEKISRDIGNSAGVADSLGRRAEILIAVGDLDQAIGLLERQAEMFLANGNKTGLAASLGDQGRVLEIRGELDRAMSLFKEQERISLELGNRKGLHASLGNQAAVYSARGELDQAMTLFKETEKICEQIMDKPGLLASLNNQALILEKQNCLDEAMTILKQVEDRQREMGNKAGVATSQNNQGLVLKRQGMLEQAMSMFKEHEKTCRALGDKRGLAASMNNQALILRARGDLEGALALHTEQERICREMGSFDELQSALVNQATVLQIKGDLDAALSRRKEAEEISRQLGNKRALGACLAGQASILTIRGRLTEAISLLKEQESICRETRDRAALASSLGSQAVILRMQSNLPAALALHKEQEQICRELNDKARLQACYGNQGVLLKDMGDLQGALGLLKMQEEICRELNNKDGLQRSLGDQANIFHRLGDLQRALALHDEEERICRELGDRDQLQGALGNRGGVLAALGRIDEAMDLFKQKEQMCRELGNINGLAGALANRAVLLTQNLNRPQEALPLAEEAWKLAETHGLVARARQIRPLLEYLRAREG